MLRSALVLSLLPVLLLGCGQDTDGTPVRVTLDDGQVLVGGVYTPTLRLEGALGTLAIPLEDVGEVVPVEGGHLGDSHGNITVWLRNGTELVGKWADPELTMGIAVGDADVAVDLPMDQLERFQMQGGEVWPDEDVVRVRTLHGDDFLIDATRTQLVMNNELGTFSPYLTECVSARPISSPEGDWRIELRTGTVLVGPLSESSLTFALPMGPENLTVPLSLFASMDRQSWSVPETAAPMAVWNEEPEPAPMEQTEVADQVWFKNASLRASKAAH